MNPTPKAHVLFDGQCALCLKSISLLRKLDWRSRLAYVDVRDATQPLLKDPQLANAPLLEQMHLVTPDGAHVLRGFDAVRWMSWRLPPLWPLAPFLFLPGMSWLGQRLYLWVARHRFQLVPCHGGVCTIQKKFSDEPTAARKPNGEQAP